MSVSESSADFIERFLLAVSLDSAMDVIMKEKFSKIPVYKDSIDNIKQSVIIVLD